MDIRLGDVVVSFPGENEGKPRLCSCDKAGL